MFSEIKALFCATNSSSEVFLAAIASIIPLNKRMRGTTGHLHEETFLLSRESYVLSLLENVLVDLVKDLLRVEVDVLE